MELLKEFIDIFLHLDEYLDIVIRQFGGWTYAILFCIIFLETGLVITPILPGDSLLFAVGTFASIGSLDVLWVTGVLVVAAILGDTVNYWIGYTAGPRVFQREDSRLFKKSYLERTHKFYEKYGGKTIILARFIPIIRTFAPFVAGIGRMSYRRFIVYNITGGIAWITFFVYGGYLFGSIPAVKKHFSFIIIAIIFISMLPGLIEFIRIKTKATESVPD
ncbi:dedA family protein [Candidatus Magnetoovum chiemensis]|nr:dedA family protein [Candidatus Magnetoovum chiemensis]